MALKLVREAKAIKLRTPYKDQFERALLSIPLNLAEGSAKQSVKDRLRFYEIALGSFKEVKTLIDILNLQPLMPIADKLGALLFCLCRALRH